MRGAHHRYEASIPQNCKSCRYTQHHFISVFPLKKCGNSKNVFLIENNAKTTATPLSPRARHQLRELREEENGRKTEGAGREGVIFLSLSGSTCVGVFGRIQRGPSRPHPAPCTPPTTNHGSKIIFPHDQQSKDCDKDVLSLSHFGQVSGCIYHQGTSVFHQVPCINQ